MNVKKTVPGLLTTAMLLLVAVPLAPPAAASEALAECTYLDGPGTGELTNAGAKPVDAGSGGGIGGVMEWNFAYTTQVAWACGHLAEQLLCDQLGVCPSGFTPNGWKPTGTISVVHRSCTTGIPQSHEIMSPVDVIHFYYGGPYMAAYQGYTGTAIRHC